jgi:4,5-dihydroxyphthalate decarboxylase
VRDLTTGRVHADGIDLTVLDPQLEEIFYRFINFREWDVSELSLCKYTALRAQGDDSLIAIPVFPSRVFRHSSFYAMADGPAELSALAGKRVGVPEWAETATVYSRGFLTHDYGVALDQVDWVQGGLNQPGRTEKVKLRLPDGVRVTQVRDRSLNQMLLAGDLDAISSARAPEGFAAGDRGVVRMIPDARTAEIDYARRTGIVPIMHVVVLKGDVYRANRWIAMNLFKAFRAAKERCVARLREIGASRSPIPWLPATLKEYQWLFDDGEWWPYGVDANRTTLEGFLGFAHEQGITDRLLDPDELFAPETLSEFRV